MPTDPYFNDLRYRYTYGFKTPVETPYDRMLRPFGLDTSKYEKDVRAALSGKKAASIPIWQDKYLSEARQVSIGRRNHYEESV